MHKSLHFLYHLKQPVKAVDYSLRNGQQLVLPE